MLGSKQLLLLICILIASSSIQGQYDITFHAKLDIEDGLKDRAIYKIDRDKDGYFWLLQTNVIQRYDGSVFSDQIAHSVPHPRYFKCLESGKILLVSQELEAYIIDPNLKELIRLDIKDSECQSCPLFDINLVGEKLILFFQDKNEIRVNETLAKDDFQNYKLIETINNQKALQLANIFKSNDYYILTSTDEKIYALKDGLLTEQEVSDQYREVRRFVESKFLTEDLLYFSLPQRMGTYKFENGKFSIEDPYEKFSFARKDKNGTIMLGLSRSFRHTEDIYLMEQGIKKPWNKLTDINGTFLDVYAEDFQDKLLLGSHTGLFYTKTTTQGIKATHQTAIKTNGFGNVVMSVVNLPNGDIYYVKEAGGIFKYNGTLPERFQASEPILNNNYSQYDASSNALLVGGYTSTQKGVLFNLDLETGEANPHYLDKAIVYLEKQEGEIVRISTGTNRGSSIVDYDLGSKKVIKTLLSVENEKIRKFENIDDNHLLVSTSKRLIIAHLPSGKTKNIIDNTYIQTFRKTDEKWIIGTYGKGVYFMDHDLEIEKIFNTQNGLTNDQIYSITLDRQGNYWIGTGYGLNAIDPNLNLLRRFLKEDGISDSEFNTNAGIVLNNGNLLLGTINGVTEVDPIAALNASESQVFNIPEISYELGGQKISQPLIAKNIKLDRSAKNIQLAIKSNDFYSNTKSSNYLPRIIELEPENSEFSVNGDVLKIAELSLGKTQIDISPPNPAFKEKLHQITINSTRNYGQIIRTIILGTTIILISFFISSRIIKRNTRKDKVERENAVRMAELELQALRSQMNPHFIFNSLGAILLYMQTNEKKKAEKYLTKFAKLMRMFLESSKSKFISFEEEYNLLALYLELEKLRFEDKFDYHFDIDDRIDVNSLTLPSMLLQPFVENSVNHGLYHMKCCKGILSIKVIPDGERVKVIIEDNGIGREKARTIKEKSLKKHKSRATEIIQERLQVLKKEKNIDIEINYQDLKDKDGQASGTKVTIDLPKLLKVYD